MQSPVGMTRTQLRIAVIGGGISGLSAAWELTRGSAPPAVTVYEAGSRWGGKVVTETVSGYGDQPFLIDGGPESFVTRKPAVWELANELGLHDTLVNPGSETRDIYVLDNGQPVAVPLSPVAFLTSPLMSLRGKLRMLAEPFVPARRDDADESLGDFAARRLGREALDKFIGPILGGIYNTDPDLQSILTTSPVMRQLERDHGGLLRGALARMLAARRNESGDEADKPPRFIAFAGGARTLIDALIDQLDADLRLNSPVAAVETADAGYTVTLADGTREHFDAVIVATMADVAASLLAACAPEAAMDLAAIRHASIGTLSLIYHEADLATAQQVQGLMIPRREGRAIDAVQWTSRRFEGARAPAGYALVRAFFGGSRPEAATMIDDELLSLVRGELRDMLAIDAEPLDYRVFRWPGQYPQADVGHLDRVARIEAALPAGLSVTGSPYRGLAVPDCVAQSRASARTLLDDLPMAVRV